MIEKNGKKEKLQIIIAMMLFVLAIIMELYAIIQYPQLIVLVIGIALLALIFLFFILDGIMKFRKIEEDKRITQYDSIFKSEKASYLLLKKHFEEIEDKIIEIEEAIANQKNEILKVQKDIAKVIVNKIDENTKDAMDESTELLIEKFASKQKDISVELKEMELRLNGLMLQSQKVVATVAPVQTTPTPEPIVEPQPIVEPEPIAEPEPTVEPQPIAEPEPTVEPEAVAEPEPIVEPESVAEPEPTVEPQPIAEPEPTIEPQPVAEPQPEEPAEELPPMPDLSDPNKQLSADEIAALFANLS